MGKADYPSPPPSIIPKQQDDNSGMMQMLMAMMQNMPTAEDMTINMPQMPQLPMIFQTPNVNWDAKFAEVSGKAAEEFKQNKAGRTGRLDTILTPLLLDEEASTTTSSLLTGETK